MFEEEVERLPVVYPKGWDQNARRVSISSECFNPQQFDGLQLPKIHKSKEEANQIRRAVKYNVVFKHLEERKVEIVVDAMESRILEPNTLIIKEGSFDDSNEMYMVAEGELDIYYGVVSD